MKKHILLCVAASLMALMLLVACKQEPGGGDIPEVVSVTISPAGPVSVAKGDTQQFTVEVVVRNGASTDVEWSVEGKARPDTGIDADGLLTVAADETATSLTVKAVSVEDRSKFDSMVVNVTDDNPDPEDILTPGKRYRMQSHDNVHVGDGNNFLREIGGELKVGNITDDPSNSVWIVMEKSPGIVALKNEATGHYISTKGLSPNWDTKPLLTAFEDDAAFYWTFDVNSGSTIGNGEGGGILCHDTSDNDGSPNTNYVNWRNDHSGWGTATWTFHDQNPGPAPTVDSVTVDPDTVSVVKGETQQFTAAVDGDNSPSQVVEWTVEGTTNGGTSISAAGLLTVASDETAETLTVKATSTVADYTYKFGTATVSVTAPVATVTSVTVSPDTITVGIGGTQHFIATVNGANSPSQVVEWTVEGTTNAGTSINASGDLTVASDEDAITLTVKATSTVTDYTDKFGTATVTVSALTPTVTSVTIDQSSPSVAQGGTLQFSATVLVENGALTTVIWSVEAPHAANTSISESGLLTVADDEAEATLTVKATPEQSGFDLLADEVTVTVTAGVPTVTNVTVDPDAVSVVKGETQQFTAEVTGNFNPATTVTWTVEGNESNDTEIDEDGELTVAADETAETLIVRATSTVTTDKSGTATVTVTEPSPEDILTPDKKYRMQSGNDGKVGAGNNFLCDIDGVLMIGNTTNNPDNSIWIVMKTEDGKMALKNEATGSYISTKGLSVPDWTAVPPLTDFEDDDAFYWTFDVNNPDTTIVNGAGYLDHDDQVGYFYVNWRNDHDGWGNTKWHFWEYN